MQENFTHGAVILTPDRKIDFDSIPKEHSGLLWRNNYENIIKSEKRMKRYKEKLSNLLYTLVCQSFPIFVAGFDLDCVDQLIKRSDWSEEEAKFAKAYQTAAAGALCEAPNFERFCAKYLLCLFVGNVQLMSFCDIPVDTYSHAHVHEHFFVDKDGLILVDYLNNKRVTSDEGEISFHEVFEHEFNAVCKSYLQREIMRDGSINEDNFMRTVPRIDDPKAQIVLHEFMTGLIPRLQYNIFQVVSEESNLDFELAKKTSQRIKSERDDYRKKLKTTERQLQKKEEDIKERDMRISLLSSKLISAEKADNVDKLIKERTEDIAYENKSLSRQNRKLQSAYSDITAKYQRLKARVAKSGSVEVEEDEEEIREVDLNARYLFVIGTEVTYRNAIKETFPNAEFVSKAVNLVGTKYDMVITLTSCVDHHYYLAIKKQCKDHSIPFAHCPYSNLDMIKTVIWNVLNS